LEADIDLAATEFKVQKFPAKKQNHNQKILNFACGNLVLQSTMDHFDNMMTQLINSKGY